MSPSETGPSVSQTDPKGYEFSADDNLLFSQLASRMQFVGLFALGLGITAIVAGALRREPGSVFGGALYAGIGLWTERAGSSFRSIAFTQGSDIPHLLHALRDLRKLYTLQFWVCFLGLLATLIFLGATVIGTRG